MRCVEVVVVVIVDEDEVVERAGVPWDGEGSGTESRPELPSVVLTVGAGPAIAVWGVEDEPVAASNRSWSLETT